MTYTKRYKNGLRLVIEKMEGLFSVSVGVLVGTGSINETPEENGISHFIEHCVFKGTKNRSAFEISDYIDRIGASINAFTSKEVTCYYTKSTTEHAGETLEVLSDLLFNATFNKEDLEKEKGIILEEIHMSEDSPEDMLFDLLSESFYGDSGLGQTILGPASNVRRFSRKDIDAYMDKYYTADNVVISVAGNVDVEEIENLVDKYFAQNFNRLKSAKKTGFITPQKNHFYKYKKIEQSHLGLAMPSFGIADEKRDALSIASIIFGGGMSSRLFQRIREQSGLAYSVYSYLSSYAQQGVLEIYAGVSPDSRDKATEKIIDEIKRLKNEGITEQEFLRGKEQLKSSFIMSRESTSSQMLLFGKHMLYMDKEFNVEQKIKDFDLLTKCQVEQAIEQSFNLQELASATFGPKRTPLKIN